MNDANIHFWDDDAGPPFDDLVVDVDKVADRLDRLSLGRGRIGMELGHGMKLGMPVSQFDRLRSLLPEATLLDMSEVMWSVRKIKSAAEIEVLRTTTRTSLTAFKAGIGSLHEGMSERDLWRVELPRSC